MASTSSTQTIAAAASLAAAALTGLAHADGTFYNLGGGNTVTALSADGSVAAGYNTSQYFHWTPEGGIVNVGGTPPGGGVGGQAGMSDDGDRFCGTVMNPSSGVHEMSVYSISGGSWTYLGGIGGVSGTETSSGWGMSGDGLSVVGLGWVDAGGAHAIQWDEGGSTWDLGSTVPDRSTRANAVNSDGSVVVGWQDSSSGFRQAAVWVDGVQTLIWDGTDPQSEAGDVSADGTWVVGSGSFANNFKAWRWSDATGTETIGDPPVSGWRGASTAISADGSVIVGFNRPWPAPATFGNGFIWTEATGMVDLNTYVADQGVDTGGLTLALPLAISADGTTIAGIGFGGVGFVVTLDIEPACAAADTNADGNVNVLDLLEIVLTWGVCADPDDCPGDTDGNDRVDTNDLINVILNWGPCP